MRLELDGAKALTDRRNAAMQACDRQAFLASWADDCIVQGLEHYLEGKQQLGEATPVALDCHEARS